jgi:hypothetical protein
MRLSELKALVDKATEQCAKHRCGDPLVCTVDFRHEGQRRAEAGDCEELRHVEEAGLIEMRSLEPACSDLEYFNREGMFANVPIFYITGDDTQGIL